jgi:hypothetical protein
MTQDRALQQDPEADAESDDNTSGSDHTLTMDEDGFDLEKAIKQALRRSVIFSLVISSCLTFCQACQGRGQAA